MPKPSGLFDLADAIDQFLSVVVQDGMGDVGGSQGGGNGMQGSDDAGGSVVAGEAGAALTLSN